MRTKTRTFALESLLAAGAVLIAGGCTHYNQFRGPEGEGDFLSPPPALGGKRYYQNR
jgi:hypothetical protein